MHPYGNGDVQRVVGSSTGKATVGRFHLVAVCIQRFECGSKACGRFDDAAFLNLGNHACNALNDGLRAFDPNHAARYLGGFHAQITDLLRFFILNRNCCGIGRQWHVCRDPVIAIQRNGSGRYRRNGIRARLGFGCRERNLRHTGTLNLRKRRTDINVFGIKIEDDRTRALNRHADVKGILTDHAQIVVAGDRIRQVNRFGDGDGSFLNVTGTKGHQRPDQNSRDHGNDEQSTLVMQEGV